MKRLNDLEYKALVSAIRGEEYNRTAYEKAVSRISSGCGVRPAGHKSGFIIPNSMKEWRRNPQWSIRLVDVHQNACAAALEKYWEVVADLPERTA
jgi:hypothetical protein